MLAERRGQLVGIDCSLYPCVAHLVQRADDRITAEDLADWGYPEARSHWASFLDTDNELGTVTLYFLHEPVDPLGLVFINRRLFQAKHDWTEATAAAFDELVAQDLP